MLKVYKLKGTNQFLILKEDLSFASKEEVEELIRTYKQTKK